MERALKLKKKQATPLSSNSLTSLLLTIRIPATASLRAVDNPGLETRGIFFFNLDSPDQLNFYHLSAINPHLLSLLSDVFYKHMKILLTEIFDIPLALASEQGVLFNYSPDRQKSQIGINIFFSTYDFYLFHSLLLFNPGTLSSDLLGMVLKIVPEWIGPTS